MSTIVRRIAVGLAAGIVLLVATTVRGHDVRAGAPERPDAIVRYDGARRTWSGTLLPPPAPGVPWRRPRCRDVPPPGQELRFASTSAAWLDALGARTSLRFGRTVARVRGRVLVQEPDGTLAIVPCARFHELFRVA